MVFLIEWYENTKINVGPWSSDYSTTLEEEIKRQGKNNKKELHSSFSITKSVGEEVELMRSEVDFERERCHEFQETKITHIPRCWD